MKLVVCTALAVLCVALVASTAAPAQEAPLDLGQNDLLLLECGDALDLAAEQSVSTRSCRRVSELVEDTRATVVVRIATSFGPFHVTSRYRKSLWSGRVLSVSPAP